MPVGLTNGLSTFARYMAVLLRDLSFVCVYLNGALIFFKPKEKHWRHLDVVLRQLVKPEFNSQTEMLIRTERWTL